MLDPKSIKDINKIVALRANAMGDFIACLPALNLLKEKYPEAELTLIGKQWHKDFLTDRPGPVDRVIVPPYYAGVHVAKDFIEDKEEQEKFFNEMQNERFDLAIQMHGGGKNSNPFTQRLGARYTLGLKTQDAEKLDIWMPYVYRQNEVYRYVELVSLLGIDPILKLPKVEVMEKDVAEVEEKLPELGKKFIVLHPGASDPRRMWPAENFAALGDELDRLGFQIVITGNGEEEVTVNNVIAGMKNRPLNTFGKLTLSGMVGLLSKATLVISNDTGPMHMADAIGTPVVGIMWCANFVQWAHLNRLNFRFVPSWVTHCKKCGGFLLDDSFPDNGCDHLYSFVENASVEDVLRTTIELLNEKKTIY